MGLRFLLGALGSLQWALPLLGAALGWAPRSAAGRERLGALTLLLTLALGCGALWSHAAGPSGLAELSLGFQPRFALDGLNVIFAPLAALLGLLSLSHGARVGKLADRRWLPAVLAMVGSTQGMLLSADLFSFAAFATLNLLPAGWLVLEWGAGAPAARAAAARRFQRFMALSVLLWLAGALILPWGPVGSPTRAVAFALLLSSLLIRAPAFPFHGWLPDVVALGPSLGLNAMLLGVKVAFIALIRFVLPLAPVAVARHADLLTALSLVGLLYGALLSLVQRDLRRGLAYVVVAQAGFILPGLFTRTAEGVEGSLLQIFNLGLCSAGLAWVLGLLQRAAGTAELRAVRRVAGQQRALGAVFLALSLATVGMPGTGGFEAVHLVVEGALAHGHPGVALAAALGPVLLAACLLWAYQKMFWSAEPGLAAPGDRPGRDLVWALLLLALVFAVGVYADPWLHVIGRAAEEVAQRAALSAEVRP